MTVSMLRKAILLLVCFLLLAAPALAATREGGVFTFWPLVDYRWSPRADVATLHLLGPLFYYHHQGRKTSYGLRPLFYRSVDAAAKSSYSEYLYPVATSQGEPHKSFFEGLHLLNYDFGAPEEGSSNRFMLFPVLFYGRSADRGSYFALFPLGGKIDHMFGQDELRFALFPLFGQTLKGHTTTTYVLWPVFTRVKGPREAGFKVWPLFGSTYKRGVYRKRFFLWPVFYANDLHLNTAHPVHQRAAFPFYLAEDSPQRSSRTWLWPFFDHVRDRRRGFQRWDFPWPLLGVTRGTTYYGVRMLPLYADEYAAGTRKRWFLWPLYKIEETRTPVYARRRDRVLFFLFSDMHETDYAKGGARTKRIALWPLFTYQDVQGVSRFYFLSLLEPFFPENDSIARNWAPFWRLYQIEWDQRGNEASSFLWNLYWRERRGKSLAMELFPLFSYRHESRGQIDFSLFKGLLRYRSGKKGKRINLFYLPWGIHWGRTGSEARG